MSESLRKSLIRLAHENPDLRPKLLPLVKSAGNPFAEFNRSYPSHKALELMDENRQTQVKTMIGTRHGQISKGEAYYLRKKGLIEEVFSYDVGHFVMTSKGRKSLSESADAWEDLMDRV